MEHAGMNSARTMPSPASICFAFGFCSQDGASLSGVYRELATLCIGHIQRCRTFELIFRALDRRRAGAGGDQIPMGGGAVRPADVAGYVAGYYVTLGVTIPRSIVSPQFS